MKIEKIRKNQLSFCLVSTNDCWFIEDDEQMKKLRDWLCELYGLPEEKENGSN